MYSGQVLLHTTYSLFYFFYQDLPFLENFNLSSNARIRFVTFHSNECNIFIVGNNNVNFNEVDLVIYSTGSCFIICSCHVCVANKAYVHKENIIYFWNISEMNLVTTML